MLGRILPLCVCVCVCVALSPSGSSLRCRWMSHKFRQCSENSLNLLEAMAEDKLCFTVQVLEEVTVLFEEDHSAASWEVVTMETFLNVVTRQTEGLRSCIKSHKKNKKLQMYFKRLSRHVLDRMGHRAEAWELIRKQIKTHLMRTDQLISSLLTVN